MGVFFDVSAWFSDPFLFGIDLTDFAEVTDETDEHHTNISMSYVIPLCLTVSHLGRSLLTDFRCLSRSIVDLSKSSTVYTYAGSLTTPPCSEAVTWFVAETPIDVSVRQYKQFKRIMKFNSRFTQNDLHKPVTDNLIADACQV